MADMKNSSNAKVWLTAGGKKHCLNAGEHTDTIGIDDPDGLLLDGRRVLFDSTRADLGGGRVHTRGAIKVCNLGDLTIHAPRDGTHDLRVEISAAGFACRPGDGAGYKDATWCRSHPGWDIDTVAVGHPCS